MGPEEWGGQHLSSISEAAVAGAGELRDEQDRRAV
jgi:hypothetical protein